jgi:hypothetical protein
MGKASTGVDTSPSPVELCDPFQEHSVRCLGCATDEVGKSKASVAATPKTPAVADLEVKIAELESRLGVNLD